MTRPHYGFKETDIAYVAKQLDAFFDTVTRPGSQRFTFERHCHEYARLIVSALKQPEWLDYKPSYPDTWRR